MKLLIRSLLVMVLLFCAYTGAQAQKLVFLFAHGQYASPMQTAFKNGYSYGLGAEAGIGIGMGKTFFTGTVGYTNFKAKEDGDNLSYIPVKVGIRQYFFPLKVLYIHADAGVAHMKVSGNSTSKFTGDVGAGVKLGPIEVGVAYDGVSMGDDAGFASWLAFKAGWRIGL